MNNGSVDDGATDDANISVHVKVLYEPAGVTCAVNLNTLNLLLSLVSLRVISAGNSILSNIVVIAPVPVGNNSC
mgnify:CR=1 FL=1